MQGKQYILQETVLEKVTSLIKRRVELFLLSCGLISEMTRKGTETYGNSFRMDGFDCEGLNYAGLDR